LGQKQLVLTSECISIENNLEILSIRR